MPTNKALDVTLLIVYDSAVRGLAAILSLKR